ncbi:hypothetical protein FFWV33_15965 [Flavobacterium faecale]|uniref:Uncharacterized protein n=1 Tax=Flavobacterium faecale TaxID=1355330 RepID=A0A2S1LGM7_9FLAO|nr:hypothetical protein [Flavobacterium faecale]AWG22915.1 hypothetical protein FFWV33_15965 [Flavobacterium faecale]
MKDEIYYVVEGTLYRNKGDVDDLIEINETFTNDDPIIAREAAFSHYQSYIEVLLESKGKTYISHKETEKELADFVKSGIKHKLLPDMVDMDAISLSIFMKRKVPLSYTTTFGETGYQDTWQIHYLDNKFEDWRDYTLKGLRYEYSLYEKNGYDCRNHILRCSNKNNTSGKVLKSTLKTPLFMEEDDLFFDPQ